MVIDSKRKSIHVKTLKRIEKFLEDLSEPMFKSDISRKLNVDYDSLNIALDMLNIKTYEDGRISLEC